MQELFATAFDVAAADLDQRFRDVAELVSGWAWRGEGPEPDLVGDQEGAAPEQRGYRMSWETLAVPERPERVLDVVLRHPDSNNPALEWRTGVQVCRSEERVSVTVRIGRGATEHVLAPAGMDLRRPGVVPRLLRAYECTANALPLRASAQAVHVGTVERFVTTLRAPDRILPAVVLAPADGVRPSVDPEALANELAGLAHVYYLGGHLPWRRFREVAGHDKRIPRGGARVYWPGFGGDNELRHPFWTAERIREGEPFERRIFRTLTRLSAGAIPPDPLIGELQRARARQRREELAAAARSGRSADEVEEDLQSIVDENAGLETRLKELEDENRELEDKNRRLQWRVDWAAAPPDDELPPDDEPEDPKTWAEFAQRLPELLSDAFVLTRRASEQCAGKPYPDPTRMWGVLERLSEAAEDYRSRGARVGNRLSDWLSDSHDLDVRPFDRRLGGRTFDYDEVTYPYSRMQHVAVDDHKDPSRCGRIYFADDEVRGRFIVDHIGLHL